MKITSLNVLLLLRYIFNFLFCWTLFLASTFSTVGHLSIYTSHPGSFSTGLRFWKSIEYFQRIEYFFQVEVNNRYLLEKSLYKSYKLKNDNLLFSKVTTQLQQFFQCLCHNPLLIKVSSEKGKKRFLQKRSLLHHFVRKKS